MNNINKITDFKPGISVYPIGLMFLPFKKLGKFQTLYHQGDLANKLFMVKSGAVKLCELSEGGDQLVHDIKTEGEIFGAWEALLHPDMHFNNSAIALSDDTEIYFIKLSEINFDNVPNSMANLSRLFLEDLKKLNFRHQRLLNNDAAYRIKETLLNLAQRAGQKFGDETLLKLWLSHDDIAKLADTSRQTVTAVMNDLKNKKKIIYSRDRILFRSLSNFHN
ncbi:Crp/Fnr family transcriptional regulator [Aquiflexum sp. TKW24L]|uniref:Crp/Fnr family transcriptional regulator n=1 Tax=Aquiflexum sp. TKW24L TaxID=2942212 RepID=UPI0020BF02FB|nr:Crp/Fnr family transcriptional regulator [Aquiflexum sp. TKW24L]MCL6259779.1 Crp/Fnr family transcriptional regulator [Aquiflexum sp. TKW24L]